MGLRRPPRHNNCSAEMLATVRRGPFAKPTALEQVEYLFTRVPAKESRKDFEKHPLEHVLSFQRRVLACKKCFLARGKRTPLGIVQDYWDRTAPSAAGAGSQRVDTQPGHLQLCWFALCFSSWLRGGLRRHNDAAASTPTS